MYRNWLRSRSKFYLRFSEECTRLQVAENASKTAVASAAVATLSVVPKGSTEIDQIPPISKWPHLLPVSGYDVSSMSSVPVPREKFNAMMLEAVKTLVRLDTNSFFLVPVSRKYDPLTCILYA